MKLTLSKEDVDKAIKEMKGVMYCCCPIYQRLKREGVDVLVVGADHVTIKDKVFTYLLDEKGKSITRTKFLAWKNLVGRKFEVIGL